MIDVGTIGSRPCEVTLNRILVEQNNPKVNRKVLNLILEFKNGLKELKNIKNSRIRHSLSHLWHDSLYQKANEIPIAIIKTHLLCVFTSHWRSYLSNVKNEI